MMQLNQKENGEKKEDGGMFMEVAKRNTVNKLEQLMN